MQHDGDVVANQLHHKWYLSKHIMMEISYEIWTYLHDHYHKGDVFRISNLQEELFTLKQGDQMIMARIRELSPFSHMSL